MIFWLDPCDICSDTRQMYDSWGLGGYSGGENDYGATSGRFGGQGLFIYTPYLDRYFGRSFANKTTITVAFAFWYDGMILGGNMLRMCVLLDGTTNQLYLQITPTGNVRVWSNSQLVLSTYLMPKRSWHWIEMKVVCSTGASGSVDVHVDGVSVGSATNVRTCQGTNAYVNNIRFGTMDANNYSGGNYYIQSVYDDIVLIDSSGSVTGFIGDSRFISSFPDANGTLNQWTPNGAANNYDCVNEMLPNSDTDYVSDATVGDEDRYTFPAINASSVTTAAVWMRSRKDDAGVRSTRVVCKSGATEVDNGADFVESTSYQYHLGVFENDPNTGSPWTVANLNVAEFGVKITA